MKKIICLLLTLVLLLGILPITASAAQPQVRVIVENTTYSVESGAPWDGVLVDEWITLSQDSTMLSCVVEALDKNGYTQEGAESNYISVIEGLYEMDGSYMAGWMGTLNDWFTNEGFGAFTAASGKLTDGDEIRIVYTCDWGEDCGGSWSNSDTGVKALSFSVGTLNTAFDRDTYSYTLSVPSGTTAVKVTPTAVNKNYQVRTFVGNTEYKRTQDVPVSPGTVITVKCGDPSWPSMNMSGGATEYQITVAEALPVKITADDLANVKIELNGQDGQRLILAAYQKNGCFVGAKFVTADTVLDLTQWARYTISGFLTKDGKPVCEKLVIR